MSESDIKTNIKTHIEGSSNPKGDPKCKHNMVYNDETMGGCGSGWYRMCEDCGFVERECT
jgi:hypothetical protein